MPNETDLISELAQLRLEKKTEFDEFTVKLSKKEQKILDLTSELDKLKLSTRDSLIASFVNKLPDDQEKKDKVKAELEETYDLVGNAKFAKFAELIIADNTKTITVVKFSGEFSGSSQELTLDEKYKIENEKWQKRKES